MNEENNFYECMGKMTVALLWFAVSLLVTWLRAWIIVRLWGWFVVSHFQVIELTMPVAYGLCLIVFILYPSKTKKLKEDEPTDEDLALSVIVNIAGWMFCLGVGAVVSYFV